MFARPVGMALGPIPPGAIADWADRFGPHGADAFERFAALVRALDLDHLRLIQKRPGEPAATADARDVAGVKAVLGMFKG